MKCISRNDPFLKAFPVTDRDRSCRWNLLSHPVDAGPTSVCTDQKYQALARYTSTAVKTSVLHVTRSSGVVKTVLQVTVQGGRERGRQKKRWEDNIKEWTGLEWNILLRKAENLEEWSKLVVKSTVVPQRSARLGDR